MARRKEIIKNICLTKEEALRIDHLATQMGLSVSQYLADPPNMLYKLLPILGNQAVKLKYDKRIEYVSGLASYLSFNPSMLRRTVMSLTGINEQSPFLMDGAALTYTEDIKLYIILEDTHEETDI